MTSTVPYAVLDAGFSIARQQLDRVMQLARRWMRITFEYSPSQTGLAVRMYLLTRSEYT